MCPFAQAVQLGLGDELELDASLSTQGEHWLDVFFPVFLDQN
jgi:hypothetical protein